MTKDNILGECKCLSKHEKDILTMALNTAIVDVNRILRESQRGITKVGKPLTYLREEIMEIIGDYNELKDKVEKTPVC